MKKKISSLLLAAMLVLSGCSNTENTPIDTENSTTQTTTAPATETITTEEEIPIIPERIYPNNAYKALDNSFLDDKEIERGSVVKFTYETKDNVGGGDTVYEKYALIYLPAGYDENDTETRYNVMYFMHGGSDSPNWFLKGEGQKSQFAYLFDQMIADGEMEPMILCFVSYYTDYRSDDTQNCLNFHHELINDLIPAFESCKATFTDMVVTECQWESDADWKQK